MESGKKQLVIRNYESAYTSYRTETELLDGKKVKETKYVNNIINWREEYRDGKLTKHSHFLDGIKTKDDFVKDDNRSQTIYYHPDGKSPYVVDDYHTGYCVTISIKDTKGRETKLPEGKITVYKACKVYQYNKENELEREIPVIVTLEVGADVKRVTPFSMEMTSKGNFLYKARVASAKVLSIKDMKGNQYKECQSFVYKDDVRTYVVGETITATGSLDENVHTTCGSGINVHLIEEHCYVWFDL